MVSSASYIRRRLETVLSGASLHRSVNADGPFVVGTSLGSSRQNNEDAAVVLHARYGSHAERDFDIAVVCDGMGGMPHGREAAILAVAVFIEQVLGQAEADTVLRLRTAISTANQAVFDKLRGAGTTLTAALVQRFGPTMYVHAGDTRMYAIGKGRDLRQLTTDDTLTALRNRHGVEDGDGQNSRLIQFVGMGEGLEPHIEYLPDHEIEALLITSDGAHGVPAGVFARVAAAARHSHDLTRRLIQLSELLGGLDNATAVVVPARFTERNLSAGAGLLIEVLTADSSFEVVAFTERGPSTPQGNQRAYLPSATDQSDDHAEAPPVPRQRSTTRKSKKGSSKKPVHSEELKLVAPMLDIEFPSGGEE